MDDTNAFYEHESPEDHLFLLITFGHHGSFAALPQCPMHAF